MPNPDSGGSTNPGYLAEGKICLEQSCTRCCRGTVMALLEEDIRRIESLGYTRERFAMGSGGLLVLKNLRHRCVFHDGTRCTIYKDRPAGCRLYPVVFAEYSRTAAMDRMCPFRDEFHLSPESRRGSVSLHHRLIEEARQRKRIRLSNPYDG